MPHTWGDFALADPELAAFGQQRFAKPPAYLATVRADGAPRLHPVTPILAAGRLFLFMEPTSPKGRDLERGSGYALHCSVSGNDGGEGEFCITGHGAPTTDAETRRLAAQSAGYDVSDRYVLFELSVESAFSTVYTGSGAVRKVWKAPESGD